MTHRISVKIYYEDTDAAGIVYYGNFLRYLERARTEFLMDRGISVSELHYQGLFFPVIHVDIHYRKPVKLGETIDITTEVAEMKNASAVFKSLVLRQDTILAEAYVTFACIDRDGKPRRLPGELRRLEPRH